MALARRPGFVDVAVEADLAGRPRALAAARLRLTAARHVPETVRR